MIKQFIQWFEPADFQADRENLNTIDVSHRPFGFRVPYEIKPTTNKGMGVFNTTFLKAGTLVWHADDENCVAKFDRKKLLTFLKTMPREEAQIYLSHMYGAEKVSKQLMFKALGDATFFNHSPFFNVGDAHDYLEFTGSEFQVDNEKECAEFNKFHCLIALFDLNPGTELLENYHNYFNASFFIEICNEWGVPCNTEFLESIASAAANEPAPRPELSPFSKMSKPYATRNAGFQVPYAVRAAVVGGRGVFVTQPVARGELIWIGELGKSTQRYNAVELSSFLKSMTFDMAQTLLSFMYACDDDPNNIVLAYGDASLINHSDTPTAGNACDFEARNGTPLLTSLPQSKDYIVALCDLEPGMEITEDYQTYHDPLFYIDACRQYRAPSSADVVRLANTLTRDN